MKKTDEPGWPMAGGLPFMPFPLPGAPAPAAPSLLDGLSGGIDLVKDFWSKVPGATPLPGFLVPTVNVEELDKRIADLRAAEKWVEVNLGLLRTTIQGLEVQRHTIAAIHSLSTMADRAAPTPTPTPVDAAAAGESAAASGTTAAATTAATAAGQWLGYLQDQFSRVAGAAIGAAPVPAAAGATPMRPAPRAQAPGAPARKKASARSKARTARTPKG